MENFELTAAEAEVAMSADLLLLKNRVMGKVVDMMGAIHRGLEETQAHHAFAFEPAWLQQSAKISKGEQYRQLPWVMLDFPRYFSGKDVFAFRTMFWWGHYFSSTLHLAGKVKERFLDTIADNQSVLAANGFQVYLGDDPWEHDFEGGNYKPIGNISLADWRLVTDRHDFLKIAKPFSLAQWGEVKNEVVAAYAALLALLDNKG
ncbi:MAG: hypothetical protein JO154_16270 [Chitinophaga sp.]|uniref:hypothetical protein n=1 Tax=Chitinophaga sp. TaxID=1869181 RepID=UPI0025BB7822|nr:hypothetical protein [Chitinophaga sp.]MBV8254157.1 hypothetical protein [Chitinophaga sp.]